MIRGAAKFDAMALMEGSFSFLGPTASLRGKAAFINSKTGKTHGFTEVAAGWSKETIQKMGELRDAMERDLAAVHYEATEESGSSSPADVPLGLGEHLQEGDVRQV